LRLALTALAVLLFPSPALPAQQPDATKPAAQVTFQFERTGIEVPKFTLSVNGDGSARYEAEQVIANARPTDDGSAPPMQHIDRKISLSPVTTRNIFVTARELNRFNDGCESKAKNIADTGKKTLHYLGDDGEGTCVYNYSQDKRVVMLTDTFLAIAATLDIGRKLDFDHRFDRLGLDAVSAQLVQDVDAGRAIEMGAIAPTLRSLAADSEVMERVRSRAAKLLQQVKPPS